jgi:hypothetical protein
LIQDYAELDTRRRRSRSGRLLFAFLAAWGLSLWLIKDGFSYGLMPGDPVTGRAEGCYTAIEDWLGVMEPTPIRAVEQLLGAILFFGVPLVLLGWYFHRKPMPNH